MTIVLTHVRTPFAGNVHQRHLSALAGARERFGERLAICGDFNTVPWPGPFRELASDASLTDTHRGSRLPYSWPTWNPLLAVPIDNCLISDGLTVLEHRSGPDVGSDHFPLIIELGITELDADRS